MSGHLSRNGEWLKQAPAGMVALTVIDFQGFINKTVNGLS